MNIRARYGFASWGLAALLLLLSCQASAATLSFTGQFDQDDQQALINFTNPIAGAVSLRTWSFGGGVNGAGTSIAAGGFAPIVSLFDGSNLLIGLAQAGVATCAGNTDAATGFCWDVLLDQILPAGDYLAVLTQDDNTPFGPSLSDGFLRDGEGNYTGPNYLGDVGSFLLPNLAQRDGHWALDISVPDRILNPVPEPNSLLLGAIGIAALSAARRRTNTNSDKENQHA